MKARLLIIYSIIYGLAAAAFCIYWAANFTKHVTYKGDEFSVLVELLFVPAYLFILAVQFTIKRINLFLALFIPLMSCIAAVCTGLIIFLLTGMDGTPRQYILLYGLLHALLTLLAAYIFWGRALKNE